MLELHNISNDDHGRAYEYRLSQKLCTHYSVSIVHKNSFITVQIKNLDNNKAVLHQVISSQEFGDLILESNEETKSESNLTFGDDNDIVSFAINIRKRTTQYKVTFRVIAKTSGVKITANSLEKYSIYEKVIFVPM